MNAKNSPPSEFEYRVSERIGILCGDGWPTKAQQQMARDEAFKAIDEIEKNNTETDDVPPP